MQKQTYLIEVIFFIVLSFMIALTLLADDLSSQHNYRTLKVAWTQTRWDNLIVQEKIIQTLIKYQFSVDTGTSAMTNAVMAQINTSSFVAAANTNLSVHVYDYSVRKARPGENDSMSYSDLVALKAKVDDDPQIAMEVIRMSESDQWLTDNGIIRKEQ